MPLVLEQDFFHLTEVFRSRESGLFSLRGFSRCACRRSLPAGAELAPRAGAGPSFLDEKKGSKDSPRGEFRFSPPWNPHSTTKGAAFGNREKLPLWFCLTRRHGLRVKQVRKGSFTSKMVRKALRKPIKKCGEAAPKNCEPTRAL